MNTRTVNVRRIFFVNRYSVRAENLAFHHFGKAQNGIQWRPQFVAHLRKKARFGDVGRLCAMSRLVGYCLGLLKFADQGILFGASFQRPSVVECSRWANKVK